MCHLLDFAYDFGLSHDCCFFACKVTKKSHICKFSWDFFHFRLIDIEFFRRVVAFDRLGLNHAARVTFLPVLGFRRHRPCHVAARKSSRRHCYYTEIITFLIISSFCWWIL